MALKAAHTPVLVDPAVRSVVTSRLLAGGTLMALGVLVGVTVQWAAGAVTLILGASLFGLTLYGRRGTVAASLINRAYDLTTRGRIAEAEALIDQAEPRVRGGHLRRSVDLLRGMIAFRRGDVGVAITCADAAVQRPLGYSLRGIERLQRAAARALRALLRGTRGDEQGAREDIAEVRASPEADANALARVELAEAILLERSGERESLRRHLAATRNLLLEYGAPRERAVVRAFERLLEAKRASVYREAASRDPERATADEPTLHDWMEAVAPAAAPFVRHRAIATSPAGSASSAPSESIDPEARRAAEARLKPRSWSKIGRLVLLWLLLIAMFLAIWLFLTPDPGAAPAPVPSPDDAGGAYLWFYLAPAIALSVGWVVGVRAHAHRRAQRLFAAVVRIARGAEASGEAELRALAKSRYALVAARAWLELAGCADRRASFAEAATACESGLKALMKNTPARAMASASLLPELVAEHAFALAALDRDAEARAEMSLLERYPSYIHRGCAELRFALLRHARRGDLSSAAALVATGTDDLPLSRRDELLAGLVRAAVHPESAGAGEIERLDRELASDVRLVTWINAVAPAALEAFRSAGRALQDDGGSRRDEEAEREAEAELEALHVDEPRPAQRRPSGPG